MSNKLLYWVDVFTPKAYTQPDKNDSLYLVIIPCILNGQASSPGVIQYLESFKEADASYTFEPLAASISNPQFEELDLAPLPFHPSVAISKTATRVNHQKGITGFSFTNFREKLNYIVNNYSAIPLYLLPPAPGYPADDYQYLDLRQRTQYGDWFTSLLTDIKKNEASISTPVKKAILAGDWYKVSFADAIREEIKKPFTPSTLCIKYLELLKQHTATELDKEKEVLPPAFQFSIEGLKELQKDAAALVLRIGSENNYCKIVADGFLSVYNKADATEKLEKTIEQIRLFFGGGERLRIKEFVAGFDAMQIFDDFTPQGYVADICPTLWPGITPAWPVQNLKVTNNYSLLGQVLHFSIKSIAEQGVDNFIKGLKVSLNTHEIFDNSTYANELRALVKAAFLNATQNKPEHFLRNIIVNPATNLPAAIRSKGKVYYYPSNSIGIPELSLTNAYNALGEAAEFFALPELLLDEMEEKPRVQYRNQSGSFIRNQSESFIDFPPQRKFFKKADVWPDGVKADNNTFIYQPIYSADSNPNNGYYPAVTVKVMIKKVRLADNKLVFKISKKSENFCQEDDQNRFKQLLNQTVYVNGNTTYECFLGYNKKDAADVKYTLAKFSISRGIDTDPDELVEIYSDTPLDNVLEALQGTTSTMEVDLILLSKTKANPSFWNCFNMLYAIPGKDENGEPKAGISPFVALKNVFKYKFNISVNGFSGNLKTELKMASTFTSSGISSGTVQQDPVVTDYVNFNKFRIQLKNKTVVKINNADALLPEFESAVSPAQGPWAFWYPVTHRFSETVSGTGTRSEADVQEEGRYQLYLHGGQSYSLEGWIEHQYAYRLAIAAEKQIVSAYSGAIRHLGQLLLLKEAQDKAKKIEIPAVFYRIANDNKTISILLNPEYLAMVAATQSLQQYRELYEAIADTINNKDRLQLFVEQWDFNNRLNTLEPDQAAHPETSKQFPAIIQHLKKNKTDVFQPQLNGIEHLLKDTFDEFTKAVAAPLPAEVVIMQVVMPQQLTSDVIRVGFEIKRAESATVLQQFQSQAGNTTIQPADLQPTPVEIAETNETSFNSFAALAEAMKGLESFLEEAEQNELYTSFAYLYSKDYLASFQKPGPQQRNNVMEIMGETARHIALPDTTVTLTKAITYYVPYSFVPLKIFNWKDSELSTARDQYEFIQYLFRILAWLAYPETQKGKLEDLVNIKWSDAPGQSLQSFHVRSRVRDEFLRGIDETKETSIAARLAELLTHVDNAADATQGDHKLVKEIRESIAGSLKASFSSLFTADPLKYINAKAVGVGLFTDQSVQGSPGRFDDLYSFKVGKLISGDPKLNKPVKEDVTHFNFLSILLDTGKKQSYYVEELEDELYDNEFSIDDKANKGIEGRTAENVLENDHPYGTAKPGKPELEIRHFCKSWQDEEGKKFYLLPSRKPPVVPMNVTLTENEKTLNKDFSPGNADWKSLINTLNKPYKLTAAEGATIEFKPLPGGPILLTATQMPGPAWNRLDTYVNQYYFLLDPDEEGEISNDLIEIFIDEANTLEDISAMATTSTVTDLFKLLEQQFIYNIRNAREGDVAPAVNIDHLVDTTQPYKEPKGLHRLLLDFLVPSGNADGDRMQHGNNFRLKSASGEWKLEKLPPGPVISPAAGDVLAVNLLGYELEQSAGGEMKAKKFLLKIAVLAEPWVHHRCRVRVRRNQRDFNNDGVFDINPAFEMRSGFSSWVDYGIQLLSYNYLESINPANWPANLKYLEVEKEINLRDYRAGKEEARKLGAVISGVLKNEVSFNKEILKRNFTQLAFVRPGYTLMPIFHTGKKIDEIKAWAQSYNDKFDQFFVDFKNNQQADHAGSVHPDMLLNPVPVTLTSLAPFIQMVWYSTEDNNQPVLSINWQLRFSNLI